MCTTRLVVLTIVLTIFGCGTNRSSNDAQPSCWIPSVYKEVGIGLIDPTWEPEEQMMGQILDSGESPKVCWYGLQDGSIEARVNASDSGYDGYLFRRQGDSWQLVDTYESITVH